MSGFLLKIIAVVFMVIDHSRYITPEWNNEITRFLGRLAFPIFALMVAEGCFYTKDIKKYGKRMLIFALASQIPYMIFWLTTGYSTLEDMELNIGFTMFFGIVGVYMLKICKNKYAKILGIIPLLIIAQCIRVDYGAFGVSLILLNYIFREKIYLRSFLGYIVLCLQLLFSIKFKLEFLNYYWIFFVGCAVAQEIIILYNGKKGKYGFKYFFYIFYPLHLLVLTLLKLIS